MNAASYKHRSLNERKALLNSPEIWDLLYGGCDSPTVKLSFEGDPHTWSQVKQSATELGIDPKELVRFALYKYFEGERNSAAARARLLAYREWNRTRPIWLSNDQGARWEPADKLLENLSR